MLSTAVLGAAFSFIAPPFAVAAYFALWRSPAALVLLPPPSLQGLRVCCSPLPSDLAAGFQLSAWAVSVRFSTFSQLIYKVQYQVLC